MVVVGQFDSPAFHQQAEEYATALEGIHDFEKVCRGDPIFDQRYMYCMLYTIDIGIQPALASINCSMILFYWIYGSRCWYTFF